MSVTDITVAGKGRFQARPLFLVACLVLLVVFLLPGALKEHRTAQWLIFILACLAILSGWFFGFVDREAKNKWRQVIALATGVYLTASTPVFFFEFSQVKWFMRGPHWVSTYARPWVHWDDLMIPIGVVGALFARGRARIALLTASILLVILWLSMSRLVF